MGLVPLTREQLRQVLRESRRSSMRQLILLYRLHGIDLQFDDGAVDALVELAEQEGTGARALMEIMLDSPGITNTRGWPDTLIRERLEAVKAKLDWANTTGSARKWSEKFEEDNGHRLG